MVTKLCDKVTPADDQPPQGRTEDAAPLLSAIHLPPVVGDGGGVDGVGGR